MDKIFIGISTFVDVSVNIGIFIVQFSYVPVFLLYVMDDFYRPKRSFGQGNIFTSVCHSVHRGGGCLLQIFGGGACSKFFWGGGAWTGTPPLAGTPLPWQAPPSPGRHPPWQAPPSGRHPPLAGTPPPGRHPPLAGTPPGRHPPRQAPPPRIRSTLGRYASYWNAFLSLLKFI